MTQHVVLVDDVQTNLEILEAIVQRRPDTQAHPFASSTDALAFAQTAPVDAFVLDYNMPSPDGREMIALLRGDARFEYVPIIIVTADTEREHRLAALSAGANDYIERPIEPQELLVRLETLLALHAARQRLASDVSDLTRSLRLEEQHSREQAERMIALWRIVSNPDLTPDDMLQAILHEGARAIRTGRTFFGTLMRQDGTDLIIEAAARDGSLAANVPGLASRIELAGTIQAALVAAPPTTRSWADVRTDTAIASLPYVVIAEPRAAICTSFAAGRSTYFLQFWSRSPLEEPFREDDHAYVELLASFFCARLQQAWQFDRITYQLSHDSLTGLRNRTQFRLDARMALAAHDRGAIAIVAIDAFRYVNEVYGHIIGDALLVEVGAALAQRAAESDVVGRLAGDTFGIFLADVGETDIRDRIARYAESFTQRFSTGDREGRDTIPLSATIGAALGAKGAVTVDALLSQADTAVFAAKREGRGRTLLFQPGMESEAALRSRLLDELARAVAGDELELYFQPHIDLQTRATVGAEALIRWNHPQRGLVLPEEFIPFAERNGYIRTISLWVLRASLKAAERIRGVDPGLRVFFNLSASDLSDMNIVHELREAARLGVHLENVGVEVTETAAMDDMGVTLQTVKALQEIGIHVAIDDFGTGYSSLALLKRLPVDMIKIDRTFISEVLAGDFDAAISEGVIEFGNRFGFKTLGEGVETTEQLAWLHERKCTYAQGYLISRPLPLDDFVGWLDGRRALGDAAAFL